MLLQQALLGPHHRILAMILLAGRVLKPSSVVLHRQGLRTSLLPGRRSLAFRGESFDHPFLRIGGGDSQGNVRDFVGPQH